ncbi:MAG: hypothetical protein BMS9Abin05_1393 [Rhodothermia bacterium]|nr:MAG: hypothetical protein BMS9Abin05_1393 [Rhodothermia bacterium]
MKYFPRPLISSCPKWTLAILFFLALSGCDSNNNNDNNGNNGFRTEFRVRYEVTGSCSGILAVGYTINGGGTSGESITLPWSFETDFNAPIPFTAVAIAASCSTLTGNNTLTAKIIVDGKEKGTQTSSAVGNVSVNVAVILN